ncbi:MAG TPA: cbb3-type cytochrome c oxidase subunit I [Methylomirabilota bacterium]|nr:cbb3-type cytochrome c oxidase subunit I [Methylomirabilota bacterium]
MNGTATFRTCAQTGLRVHDAAERMIRVHAVAGVLAILFGGLAAVLVLLTRWPAVHLLGPALYYRALTFHGINMLIFWIIFFEIAILYFAGPILLGSRVAWPRVGWAGFGLMVVGSLLIDVAILRGGADVMFTSYVPLRAVSYFYLGWILFAVGALIGVLNFFATLVVARAERTYEGSIPLVTFGAATAAIIAVVTLAHGAIIYIPTWLWSLGIIQNLDAGMYRLVWWGLGHPSQQINVTAMVAVWYLLATLTVGAIPVNEKVCRTAFLLYILFINLASAHHLLVDPQLSPSWKVFNTSYGMYLAVLASMVHGMTVPAAVETAQRKKGLSKGLFEWLAKAPWGNPGFAALALSLSLFGFMGGITGVTFGAEQVNIISHNTLRIPGHFHSTVVAGTTLAFMGLTYYVVPLIFRRRIVWPRLATAQIYLFGIGIALFAAGMTTAGSYAIPRRHWDVQFANSIFQPPIEPAAFFFLGLMGIGGLLAGAGGALYVLLTVVSVFFGSRVPDTPGAVPLAGMAPAGGKHAPISGTMVLVFVFLAAFVIYYFLNWKWLAAIWYVR